MKITKRQLRRIIKEEKQKMIKEQWGSNVETGSDLLDFAKAYAGLGNAIQEQVDQIVSVANSAGPDTEAFEDAVAGVNPNALDRAVERLSQPARILGGEAEDILNVITFALELIRGEEM